jgi:hypothetical protein
MAAASSFLSGSLYTSAMAVTTTGLSFSSNESAYPTNQTNSTTARVTVGGASEQLGRFKGWAITLGAFYIVMFLS